MPKISRNPNESKEEPLTIEQLGKYYFFKKNIPIVYWINPISGEINHSGAKVGKNNKPGKRWCPYCCKAFSANNFQSQHIRNLHTPYPPINISYIQYTPNDILITH